MCSSKFCSKLPRVSYVYTISNMPIKCVDHHRDLGITMSANLQWSDHIRCISSRAYRFLGLICRSFSMGLDPISKRTLYISFVRSQLTYCSQIWRPHLLKDIISLERICIHSYINSSTRSTTHLKLKHSLVKSNTIGHFYFNRLPRLWNSLPTFNLDLPISTIKKKLLRFFWDHFNTHFQCNNPCTFHYVCPCAKCVRLPIKSNCSFL